MSVSKIAPAEDRDMAVLNKLRRALWPDAELWQSTADGAAFLAWDRKGAAIGFAKATLRQDYVNGCEARPIAFLEGLFVDPAHRGRGVARGLVEAVATWGRGHEVRELASDAALDNRASHAFHRAAGFEETERVVFFRRVL